MDGLFEQLPQQFGEYNHQNKTFFRFYFAIHAYLENRLEGAHRETQNLSDALRSNKQEFNVLPIAKFFTRFFNLQLKFMPDNGKRLDHLTKLYQEITNYSTNTLPEYRSYLPFIWLKRELKKQFGR